MTEKYIFQVINTPGIDILDYDYIYFWEINRYWNCLINKRFVQLITKMIFFSLVVINIQKLS